MRTRIGLSRCAASAAPDRSAVPGRASARCRRADSCAVLVEAQVRRIRRQSQRRGPAHRLCDRVVERTR
jgi:hypothetical protein